MTAAAATSLPTLSREELTRCRPPGEDEGFGALATPRGNLPLVAMDVDARVCGLLAEVSLTQRFSNPHRERLEATYIFPLPDRGALTRLRMQVADRTIEGHPRGAGEGPRELRRGHREGASRGDRGGGAPWRLHLAGRKPGGG